MVFAYFCIRSFICKCSLRKKKTYESFELHIIEGFSEALVEKSKSSNRKQTNSHNPDYHTQNDDAIYSLNAINL